MTIEKSKTKPWLKRMWCIETIDAIFRACMYDVLDLYEEYPDIKVIRLVTDNLNTHKEKAFYETFSKEEAERILSKIEFHYTPKHAS